MIRLLTIALAVLLSAPAADARHLRRGRRPACRPAAVYQAPAYQSPVYAAPQAPAKVMPAAVAPVASVQGDGPAEFLTMLNEARARVGRPALAWDATLAAYAATNAACHMPGSSGGAAQCWSSNRSYRQSFAMWAGSPAHWAVLMNATTSIGVAPCPTGLTANAR